SASAAFGGRLRSVVTEVNAALRAGRRAVIVSQQSARLTELFQGEGLAAAATDTIDEPPLPGSLSLVHGSLSHGWTLDLPDGPLVLATDSEIFGFTKQSRRAATRERTAGREAFLAGLTPGDLVVHVEHGIARFAGLVRRRTPDTGVEREYLELRYAE